MNALTTLSPRYREAFKSSLFQQSWVLLATALLLESLKTELFVMVAIFGHWLIMLLIAIRRPEHPTRADLLFCDFGFVPVGIITFALGPIVWLAVGDTTLYEKWFGSIIIAEPGVLLPLYVVAGIWIVVYVVMEIFWRKATPMRVKAAGEASMPSDETASESESPAHAANTSPALQPAKVKRPKKIK